MISLLLALLATVPPTYSPPTYVCDGSTAGPYTINFPYLASADVQVTSVTPAGVPTTLVIGTDYLLSVTKTSTTATLTLTNPAAKCPSGNLLKLTRATVPAQPISFKAQSFDPSLVETATDRNAMVAQQFASTFATASVGGLLTAADWARFNAATAIANASTTGLLTATDWARFDQTNLNFLAQFSAAVTSPILGTGATGSPLHLDFTVVNTWTGTQKFSAVSSNTVSPSVTGAVRLAKTDQVGWRNNANTADLGLGIDTGNNLTFGGANVTGNPMLYATNNVAQSIPNSTSTIVVFGTSVRDTDAGLNTSTGRYTVPTGKGGDYEITSVITWGASTTASSIGVFKNSVVVVDSLISVTAASSQQVTAVLNLAAGDIVDIRVLQTSGAAVTFQNPGFASRNFFALKRIP